MKAAIIATLGIAISIPLAVQGQASERGTAFSVSVGIIAPSAYHAPISPFGRTAGPSASIAYGPPPGRTWLAPRVSLSGHSAKADASRIHVFRLDGGLVIGPPRPLGSVAPFLSIEGGGYLADYNRCGVPFIVDSDSDDPAHCHGTRYGIGWQAGVGAVIRNRRGPAPFAQVRYMESGKGVDAVVFLIGAIL